LFLLIVFCVFAVTVFVLFGVIYIDNWLNEKAKWCSRIKKMKKTHLYVFILRLGTVRVTRFVPIFLTWT
jgi:hypothetical protein